MEGSFSYLVGLPGKWGGQKQIKGTDTGETEGAGQDINGG